MRVVSAIAHRGFSAAAPENTLGAFNKAIELSSDMMECDVRRTKDGHIVVIHDATLDRTTNGTGAVADMSLAEIKELDAGSWLSPEFAGEHVPTLEEVLDLAKGKCKLIVEIKEPGLEDAVVDMINDREMHFEVLIASFYYRIGVRMPELDENILFVPLIHMAREVGEDEAVRLADEAAVVNGSVFGVNYGAISPALAKATHMANMRLMAWTVDDEENMCRMVDAGVDMIASNKLDLLLSVLSAG